MVIECARSLVLHTLASCAVFLRNAKRMSISRMSAIATHASAQLSSTAVGRVLRLVSRIGWWARDEDNISAHCNGAMGHAGLCHQLSAPCSPLFFLLPSSIISESSWQSMDRVIARLGAML